MGVGVQVSRGLLFGEKHKSLQSCRVGWFLYILTRSCSLQLHLARLIDSYTDGTWTAPWMGGYLFCVFEGMWQLKFYAPAMQLAYMCTSYSWAHIRIFLCALA